VLGTCPCCRLAMMIICMPKLYCSPEYALITWFTPVDHPCSGAVLMVLSGPPPPPLQPVAMSDDAPPQVNEP
jgi:hypothetical protein